MPRPRKPIYAARMFTRDLLGPEEPENRQDEGSQDHQGFPRTRGDRPALQWPFSRPFSCLALHK